MPYSQRSLHRAIFRTAHKILLDRFLSHLFLRARGHVLVLGAGMEPYHKLLKSATKVILSDIDSSNVNLDLVVDAHSIPFPDRHFESIIAIEVFEHLQFPWQAASEIYRVLKPGGTAIISVPFMFRIHGDPHDYQRFTVNGIQSLFSSFSQVEVIPFGSRVHVVSDIITTALKPFALLRIFNHILTLPLFNSKSYDCPSGYVVSLGK